MLNYSTVYHTGEGRNKHHIPSLRHTPKERHPYAQEVQICAVDNWWEFGRMFHTFTEAPG